MSEDYKKLEHYFIDSSLGMNFQGGIAVDKSCVFIKKGSACFLFSTKS